MIRNKDITDNLEKIILKWFVNYLRGWHAVMRKSGNIRKTKETWLGRLRKELKICNLTKKSECEK